MTKQEKTLNLAFIIALSILPVIAVDMPRFYGLGPEIAGAVFLALYWLTYKEKPRFNMHIWVLPSVVFGLAALSLLWSIAPETSLERVQKLPLVLIPGTLLLTLIYSIDIEKLRPYLWLIPAGVLCASALIFVEILTSGFLYKLIRGLPADAHLYPAVFNRGSIAVTLSLFPAFFILKNYIKTKTALIIFSVASLAMFLSIESQSAQMAFILGLLAFFLFPYKSEYGWWSLKALCAFLVPGAPFVAIWAFKNFAATLNALPFFGEGQGYAGGRLEIWDYVSRYALQKPVFGHGIEATKTIKNFASGNIYDKGAHILHPHNFALQFWIEFGVFGAVILCILIGYVLWLIKTFCTPAQARIALPTYVIVLSAAATSYGFWQSWWLGLLFMTAALCMLAIKLEKQN